MGTVLSFPAGRERRGHGRSARRDAGPTHGDHIGSAQIYILPVVRIERHLDGASDAAAGPSKLPRKPHPSQRQA